MKGKFVTVAAVMTVDGTVDLSTKTTNLNTVIKSLDNSVPVTLAIVADSPHDNGSLDESKYPAITLHFKDGVTSVQDVETLFLESMHIVIVTPGTEANILHVTVDEHVAFALASGTISAALDQCQVDLTGMTNISIFVNQIVDSGTVTLVVEKSIDGVNWSSANANLSEASFAAGANEAVEVTLSDTNGMPTVAKAARVTCSAYGASGTYSVTAAGLLTDGYR